MDIQKIPAARLNPAAYNPRKDLRPGDREYEKLKRSIAEFGYVEPVIWNCRTGNVVGGHQRLKVLVDMGQTEIDCVVVDLDLRREKALNIALNKIQGDWDEEKLASLIAEFDATDFDVSLTGFEASEVDALLNRFYSHDAQEDEFDCVTAYASGAPEAYNDQEYTWVSAFAAHSFQFVKRLTREERRKWGYAGVWEISAMRKQNGETQIPIELPWRCLKMHTDVHGLALDPFAGLGSTLIACEQSGRRCRAIEADALHCDLIVRRWEQFTGEQAIRL